MGEELGQVESTQDLNAGLRSKRLLAGEEPPVDATPQPQRTVLWGMLVLLGDVGSLLQDVGHRILLQQCFMYYMTVFIALNN